MDRAWDTSKYHPKLSVGIFKAKAIQGHDVKERLNWKLHVWVAWYLFLGQFSVKNTKNNPGTPSERPKPGKIWKSRRYRNPREQREKWSFSILKYQNSVIFRGIYFTFAHIYTWQFSFTYISFFENSKVFSWFFKNIFPRRFSQNIRNFQSFENPTQQ